MMKAEKEWAAVYLNMEDLTMDTPAEKRLQRVPMSGHAVQHAISNEGKVLEN